MDCAIESEGMHYEGNCIRPPSEAFSILLQVTVGCSHNKCTFCGTYKDKRFNIKDDRIILSDILFASKYMKKQNRVFLMDGDSLIIPQKRLLISLIICLIGQYPLGKMTACFVKW